MVKRLGACLAAPALSDERPGERQAFEQQRDGGDLVGLGLARLLAEHEALAAGPGRDHVERAAVAASVVGASRGLAVDDDDLGGCGGGAGRVAQGFDPGREALGEQRAADRVDDVVERVVAGDARLVGQHASQKLLVHVTQRLISTKSSAPASVPHSTSSNTSGSGNKTFQDWRGSSRAAKWSTSDEPGIGKPPQTSPQHA